jgi:serine/threonine-protein kinase
MHQPAGRVVHILHQACHSLYEAHERGLLHRDIKPSNIFLCHYGMDPDFVKVLDFGLAKARSGATAATQEVRLTAERRVTGTPTFMAPETVLGGQDADARLDLYALGCIGYWLLSGRLVFERVSPEATMRAHLNEPPTPIAELRPDVPASLAEPIMACLAKEPAARPATAEELDHLLRASGLAALWTTDRAESWWEEWECGEGRPVAPRHPAW